MKNEDLMKVILSGATKEIIKSKNCYKAVIFDEELDPVKCKFYGDYAVKLNTKDYQHLILNIDNLETLIEMIHETEDLYQVERNKEKLEP